MFPTASDWANISTMQRLGMAAAAEGGGEAALGALRATLPTVKHEIARVSPGASPLREPSASVYRVDRILGKRAGTGEYRVRWKGRDASEDSWEPVGQLGNAANAVAEYERRPSPPPLQKKKSKE